MEEETEKPWYKKYWWAIVIVLFIFWIIGKNAPEKETTRDYVAESNQIYERLQNPKSMEQMIADYQKAEQLLKEIKQLNDTTGQLYNAELQMEAMIKFKDKTLKDAEQKIKIKNLQDEWNGGFKAINKAIKSQMHDPDSFEHVNTEYKVKDNKIIAYTEYRGKNAFNAKVLGNVMSVIDFDGNILEFKSGE